jgi:transcriptional regulator with XRE-family HTH domain
MDVGKRFRELRKNRGWEKLDQFAFEKGIGRTLISNFENGHSSPGIDKIERMCRLLPCSLAEFFADEDQPHREYRGSKLEVIQMDADQQEWVERLLKVLQSRDRAIIGIVQNALLMSDKIPDKQGSELSSPSKKSGAGAGVKKEKGRPPKARAS